MNLIKLSEIKIAPNRQRQLFDPDSIQELSTSITKNGLFHAPVCREDGKEIVLVAGERRLKAIENIYMLNDSFYYNGAKFTDGLVPYILLGDLDELQHEEAELEENIRRVDLTWQEKASAHQRLNDLRERQMRKSIELAEDGVDTGVGEGDEWTHADTAEEIFGPGKRSGNYQAIIRKECIIANHLDDPDIQKAKSLKEGFKILQQKETQKKNTELANAIGLTFSARNHTLINEDCLIWMKGKEGIFDVICTDPPYGMGADKFGDAAGKLTGITHDYDDSYASWKSLMEKWPALAYKICKAEAHAYVFCDPDRFYDHVIWKEGEEPIVQKGLRTYMQEAGWYVFRTPFICCKPGSGRVPLPEHGPRRQYEICLYAIKGKKQTTRIYPDVISVTADKNDGHGATKPVALFTNLLQRSIIPGSTVLDSFCGSGPIFGACQLLQCAATGIESSKESYGLSLCRLQDLKNEE